MSGPGPSEPPGPQREPTTVLGAASRFGDSLLSTLPPAFLVLVALNVAFLGTVLWFIDDQMNERTAMANKMMDACIALDRSDRTHP
jgi:hypothetical protein